ncbi:alcohol dehydrogenase catalytic domain-containing protein [Oceanobacillus damuensis]|uniref:alcohol dehydrogenase catalytic domain-containing protein n=1 Tax=Oceanobacillus damuensis TaxID=937928 RepID=UPI00082A109C|nr:alcohol dehydrogenase catalytic domain-containing protein [Oceanobacillus damuensis]
MKTKAAILNKTVENQPFKESEPLLIKEVDISKPGKREVMIKVMAAGLCQSDVSVIKGYIDRPRPMIIGHEAAGIVYEVGEDVRDFKPGDKVVTTFVPSCGKCLPCSEGRPALCELGVESNKKGELFEGGTRFSDDNHHIYTHVGVSAFSQYTVVSENSLVKVDTEVPFEYLALFGCSIVTGVGAIVNAAKINLGETICILGLGGVGFSALIGAKAAGAARIIAIDVNQKKLQMAKELSEDIEVYTPDQVKEKIIEVDVAVETAGVMDALKLGYSLVKRGGRVVTTGLPGPDKKIDIPIMSVTFEEKEIKGSYLGSCIPKRDIPRFLELYSKGKLPIDKLLSKTILLEDINSGFDDLVSGDNIRIVVKFD